MSPIERAFKEEWMRYCGNTPVLKQEHRIGRYRVDFAHLPSGTVIELDGRATHSSADDIAYDRKRERELEQLGWHVIRFGGKEVMRDAHACVVEACDLIMARWEQCGPTTMKQASDGRLYRSYESGDRVHHPVFGDGFVLHAGKSLAGVQFHDRRELVKLEDISVEAIYV